MHALRHRHIPIPKCRPDFSMSKAGCNLAKQRLHPRFFLDYLTASASHLQRTFSKSHRILYKISSISLFHFYFEYFLHYTSKNLKLQQIFDFTARQTHECVSQLSPYKIPKNYKFISSFNRFSGLVPIAYLFFFMLNGRLPISASFKTFSASFLIILRL